MELINIEVDEMPKNCWLCEFRESRIICNLASVTKNGKFIKAVDDGIPDICPLKLYGQKNQERS